MKGMAVEYKGKNYRYIFSLLDVFSRYHWLVPLERKKSSHVKQEIQLIYKVHGIPERFCERNKIKMIRCLPYNPKAQGKVERSHRVLRRKIYYDLVEQKRTGVNWVKHLPDMKCLNHEKLEELAWKSPFEIYYGRKPNELVNEGDNYEKIIHTVKSVGPSKSDYYKQNRTAKNWRNMASKAEQSW